MYDNARGFTNYAAPGAERFKVSLKLAKKSKQESALQAKNGPNGILHGSFCVLFWYKEEVWQRATPHHKVWKKVQRASWGYIQ